MYSVSNIDSGLYVFLIGGIIREEEDIKDNSISYNNTPETPHSHDNIQENSVSQENTEDNLISYDDSKSENEIEEKIKTSYDYEIVREVICDHYSVEIKIHNLEEEEFISVSYEDRVNLCEHAVTVDLESGEPIILKEFSIMQEDIYEMIKKDDMFEESLFLDEEMWRENRDEMYSEWSNEEDVHYYDYYILEKRVGVLFPYSMGNRETLAVEIPVEEIAY